ncbi:hypothetical protein CHS0354_040377 [Potamilus streckersoni]|uniref:LRRCT domain-containing protein n=1 Tax=Potamilus streckersoni TaxID=2493646 RepID=A0AAE0VNP6_9BIVA|nr:hypothetical protein CHS0354_040377 [Potamilus streckersoni]
MANEREPVCIIILLIMIMSQSVVTCPSECQSCKGGAVRCPGIGLRQPPPNMPDDTVLIDLTGNDIMSLNQNSFAGLSNVQSLRLPGNKLTSLEGLTFKAMPSMMSLDLSQNHIALIDDKAFNGLQELLTLSLTGNQLTSIGGFLYELPMLHNLRLMNNIIGSIGKDDFKNNEQIKMLDISNNKVSTIHSEAFAKLKMLRYLILTSNPIVSVPDLTFTSDMLQLVDFSNCKLQAVPKTMPSSVSDFRLGFNEISELKVDDFKGMTNLRLLTINDNKIGNIEHRTFWNLTNLKEIWLTRNQMVYIPRGIPANVEKLYMDSNMVFELEQMLFPVNSKLEFLTIEMNTIRRVDPESLKELRNLKDLNLQGNQISQIEANTFNNLPYLENLKLTQNPIQTIEKKAFDVLPNLTTLAMAEIYYPQQDGPQILQENILSAMPRLETLDLSTSHYLAESLLKIISLPDTQPIPSIKIVKLQNSDLKTLSPNVRQVFPSITSILLDGNMWSCDIHLMWLRDWMQQETVHFYTNEEPMCHSPQHLMGRPIKSLKDSDFSEPQSQIFPNEGKMAPVQLPPVPEDTATDVTDTPVLRVKETKQEKAKSYKATRVIIRGKKNPDNPTQQSDASQVIPDRKVAVPGQAQSDKPENQKQIRKQRKGKQKNREKRQKSGKTGRKRKHKIGKEEKSCNTDENGILKCQKKQERKEKIKSDSTRAMNKRKNV